MQTPGGEKKERAEKFRRYRAQEEWKQEEQRRIRQQARRDQDKRAPKQGRWECGIRISSPSGAPLRASTNLPAEPHAPAKHTEIIQSLTPSRLKVVDLVIPQGTGGTYTPNTHRVTAQGPRGVEACKSRSRQEQEVPREEDCSSRRPVPHQQEKANRRTAQDRAGQEAPRPGHQERHPQRPTPPRREKPPLGSEREGTRVGVARIQSTPE